MRESLISADKPLQTGMTAADPREALVQMVRKGRDGYAKTMKIAGAGDPVGHHEMANHQAAQRAAFVVGHEVPDLTVHLEDRLLGTSG